MSEALGLPRIMFPISRDPPEGGTSIESIMIKQIIDVVSNF